MQTKKNGSDLNSVKKCSNCGEEVPNTPFCPYCGIKIENTTLKDEKLSMDLLKCPFCNNNTPKTKYCIHCGKNIENLIQSLSYTNKESQELSNEIICPLCRISVPNEHNFCHICGGRLKKEKTEQTQNIICNNCWKANVLTSLKDYCVYCGALLIGTQGYRSSILNKQFEGYKFELSEIFKPTTVPISVIQKGSTSKTFPSKSVIVHSSYFSLKDEKKKLSFFSRNFGGFNKSNLYSYFITYLLILVLYSFWYFNRYSELSNIINLPSEIILIIISASILLFLLMVPIWIPTYLIYKQNGYRLKYKLESSKIFVTVIFNFMWMFFGFGPILLRIGDFYKPDERMISQKSFVKGIAYAAIIIIFLSSIFGLMTLTIVGVPGWFSGFFFQNNLLKNHIIAIYFGATWITLLLLLPLGDYFDRVIKSWNLIGYFILLTIAFILITHSFNLMGLLTQITLRA